jgi:hypothetical protein
MNRQLKNILFLASIFSFFSLCLLAEGSRRFQIKSEGLHLMDVPPQEILTKNMPQKVEVLLPDNLRLQKITSPMDLDLTLTDLKGKAYLISPKKGRLDLDKTSRPLMAWDRLVTEKKSEITIKSSDGSTWILGSNGLLQIMKKKDETPILRLLKGRLRIRNPNEETFLAVETLNSMLSIPSGTTDVIISAMNTLVAPREGTAPIVTTGKTKATVPVGRYGFISHDGSLLFSQGK